MRKYSIYLHEEIIETLKCFGDLNEVINKLFRNLLDNDMIPFGNVKPAPDRTTAKRVDVYLDDYIICQIVGFKLRPIIYWFVENEIYLDLNWIMKKDYGEDLKRSIKKQFDKTVSELSKLNNMTKGKYQQAIELIRRIENE